MSSDGLPSCIQVIIVAPLEDGKDDAQEFEAVHKLHRLLVRPGLDKHIDEKAKKHDGCKHFASEGSDVRAWVANHTLVEEIPPKFGYAFGQLYLGTPCIDVSRPQRRKFRFDV